MNKIKQLFSTRHFKHGSYSVGISVVVIAIVVVVNLLLSQLPQSVRNLDMSSSKIYTTGEVTKEVLDKLGHDVQIHVIAQEKNIDTRIKQFVEQYASLSSKVTWDMTDPVLHPSVLETYGVSENSIVVECTDTGRTRSFALSDVISYDQMSYYYYGQYVETEFDGEGLLTSAVDYVTTDVTKKIYLLEGHGEGSLGTSAADMISKQNFETDSLNLLTDKEIPEDCDLLVINGAASDIAEDEKTLLLDYMDQGGNMMIILGNGTETLKNLEDLMAVYGMTVTKGYIADAERYYQNNMYNIFPKLVSGSGITDDLGYDALVLLSQSRGFTTGTPQKDSITVTPFMNTTDNGYAVDGEAQTQGTYTLGAVAVDTVDEETTARLTVLGSQSLIADEIVQAFPSLVNLSVFVNAVTENFDDVSSISIAAKSLQVNNNTVTNGGMYGLLFIGVIPVVVLVSGLVHWMRRRKA